MPLRARRPAATVRPARAATIVLALLAAIAVTVAPVGAAPSALPPLSGDLTPVHDPHIVISDGTWYVFSTGSLMPVRSSTDGVHWVARAPVFAGGLPPWVPALIPGGDDVWAPDVSYFGGRWHLYYARSQFATSNSVIGVATNSTLDDTDPAYAWVDEGEVVRTLPGADSNAIDPNVVIDEHGDPWLAWGSFGDGIFIQRLDPATGKLVDPGGRTNLARRNPEVLGIEGTNIIRANGAWWLFASFGFCCKGVDSNYSIHVGRSTSLTGPYVDAEGVPMMDSGGTLVVGSHGAMHGPGHGTAIDVGGQWLLAHHFYDGNSGGIPTLAIDPVLWAPDGWPMLTDRDFVPAGAIALGVASGVWHVAGYREDRPAHVPDDVELTLRPDGSVDGGGTWRVEGAQLHIEDVPLYQSTKQAQVRDWWLLIDATTAADAVGRDDRTALVRATRTGDAPPTTTTTTPASSAVTPANAVSATPAFAG